MELILWSALGGLLYPYVVYPALLWVIGAVRSGRPRSAGAPLPGISLIIPVSNEEKRISRKVSNTAALVYPADRLQVIFVSDGSTDRTVELIRQEATPQMVVVELPARRGKAAGLNAGLELATNEIVVFSDAAIELEAESLMHLVAPFHDPQVGCVSGEDRIPEIGGEALYGRFELMLRRLESNAHSIVGASGSFYAQRRALCAPFLEGLAPDFLSVLRTAEARLRAVSEPTAAGSMTSVKNPRQEFERKVRTLLRGITTLAVHAHLLNPFRYGQFAFALFSHKVMRWLAPVFMVTALAAPMFRLHSPFYVGVVVVQVVGYALAWAAYAGVGGFDRRLAGKIALFAVSVNAATAVAWVQYFRGVRQELWTPSQR